MGMADQPKDVPMSGEARRRVDGALGLMDGPGGALAELDRINGQLPSAWFDGMRRDLAEVRETLRMVRDELKGQR